MKNKEIITKTIPMTINETKTNLISVINNSNLPICILELMIKDIYQEIKLLAMEQLKRDIDEYQNSLIEQENTEVVNESN